MARVMLLIFVAATFVSCVSPTSFPNEAEVPTPNDPSCKFIPKLNSSCRGTYQNDFAKRDHLVLAPHWEERARVAVKHLNGSRSVLDYGSGTGFLRTLLPPSVRYHAVDIRRHSDYVAERCNINEGYVTSPQSGSYDIIFALGLLEYVCDPPTFLNYLHSFNTPIILSYTAYYPGAEQLELANTMVQHQLDDMLTAAGFEHRIVDRLALSIESFTIPQVIMLLRPTHLPQKLPSSGAVFRWNHVSHPRAEATAEFSRALPPPSSSWQRQGSSSTLFQYHPVSSGVVPRIHAGAHPALHDQHSVMSIQWDHPGNESPWNSGHPQLASLDSLLP